MKVLDLLRRSFGSRSRSGGGFEALRQQADAATASGGRALDAGDADLAHRLLEEGLALTLRCAASRPSDPWVEESMQAVLQGVGRVMLLKRQPHEAAKCFTEALVKVDARLAADPADLGALSHHRTTHSLLADACLARGESAGAAEHLERALTSGRRALSLTPKDPRAIDGLRAALEQRGKLAASQGDPAASAYFDEARALTS